MGRACMRKIMSLMKKNLNCKNSEGYTMFMDRRVSAVDMTALTDLDAV